MKKSRNTFMRVRMFMICCTCLFFAGGVAWSQMVSAQVDAPDGNTGVSSGSDSVSRSSQVGAQANVEQQLPRVQAEASNKYFSASQSQKMFEGGSDVFSATNRGRSLSGFRIRNAAAAFSGSENKTVPIAAQSMAQSGRVASTAGIRVTSSGGLGGETGVQTGQFPDTTREQYWPSPVLYQDSNPFLFRTGLPVWLPSFGKTRLLNPSYLVNGTTLNLHKQKKISGTELQTSRQLTDPLSRLHSGIHSELHSLTSRDGLQNSLKDPLAGGN